MATVNGHSDLSGELQVVTWDLDTTGRRLIDEICQIGATYVCQDGSQKVFSQYVMPYRNPNPGAQRSFGIRVSTSGRFRLLKDMETGQILKTKSEISALQDFLDWLKDAKGNKKGVLLVSHEPTRKVVVPLLLEALGRYHMMESFCSVVAGFVNSSAVIDKYGDKSKITSSSLRSLCKTVLNNTNPSTTSAAERSKIVLNILSAVMPAAKAGDIDVARLSELATLVRKEKEDLKSLKDILTTQGTLRPIFEQQLKQRKRDRERAMKLRTMLAESGFDYSTLAEMFKTSSDVTQGIKAKLQSEASEADVEEIINTLKKHFVIDDAPSETNENEN